MFASPDDNCMTNPGKTQPSHRISAMAQNPKAELYASLPITTGPNTFRVLELQASKDRKSPLTGYLRAASLDQGVVSSYHALSYVWGEYSCPRDTISINGAEIEITKNCCDALRRLRELHGTIRLWVDSICINQEAREEKNHQIPLMRDVYLWADIVYIWMGESTPALREAVKLFRLAAATNYVPLVRSRGERWRSLDRWKALLRLSPPSIAVRAWISGWNFWALHNHLDGDKIDAFLNQEWFLRAWTFQEVLLADNPVMLYDDDLLSWGILVNSMHSLKTLIMEKQNHRRAALGEQYVLYGNRLAMTEAANIQSESPYSPAFGKLNSLLHVWIMMKRPQVGKDGRRDLAYESMQSFMEYQRRCITEPLCHYIFSDWRFLYLLVSFSSSILALFFITVFLVDRLGVFPGIRITDDPMLASTFIVLFVAAIFFSMIPLLGIPLARSFVYKVVCGRDASMHCIVRALRERKATDPKDKSYAMHGVLQKLGIIVPAPDYGKSRGKTYHELLVGLLSWHPEMLGLLLDAGRDQNNSAIDMLDTPSWVPNWQDLVAVPTISSDHISGSSMGRYNATRGSSAIVILEEDCRKLRVRGHWKGHVTFSTARFQHISYTSIDCSKLTTAVSSILNPIMTIITWLEALEDLPRSILPQKARSSWQSYPNDHEGYDTLSLSEVSTSEMPAYDTYLLGIRETLGHVSSAGAEALLAIHATFRKKANWPRNRGSGTAALARVSEEVARELLENPPQLERFVHFINELAENDRRLFTTSEGLVGCGTNAISAGDRVALISGVSAPLILKPVHATVPDWFGTPYTVVSSAFIPALMDGTGFVAEQSRDIALI